MTTMTSLTAAELTKIEARIKELEAMPRELIGSDTGTHGKPATHAIYLEITGDMYGVRSFGGANGTRCTVAEAEEQTDGRIHWTADSPMRRAITELKNLRRQIRSGQ